MECNFKVISSSGNADHVYWLDVICHRHNNNDYYYTVEGQSYEKSLGILISSKSAGACDTDTFDTPEEAFAFADKIVKKYPRYGDDRDLDIELAPLYDGVGEEPIGTKICKKEKKPGISEDTAGKNIANEISPISSIAENSEVVKREFSVVRTILAEYIKSNREHLSKVIEDYKALGGDLNDIS